MTAETGPRSWNVLRGLASEAQLGRMRERGEIVLYGTKRGSKWGTPNFNPRRKA